MGIGSGRVISSGPSDTVFFYFADHGAPGILGMPFGPFLYANDFVQTLVNKSNSNGFAKMVVYIEACESGSVFKVPTQLSASIRFRVATPADG
eukprot:scaffold273010_cov22-Prasinocladus_malaysianus.AAC.1